MQSRRISLGREPCPLHQCVKANIHIGRPIATDFATGSEDEMLLTFKPENLIGWRNIESIPVSVIGLAKLCTVSLGAANVRHDQILLVAESYWAKSGFIFAEPLTN
jgi:hypothetical protein